MQPAKCTIFQSTFLGMAEDPRKDGCWENMWKTIQNGKQPFKYIDRLEIAFADINATDPDKAFLSYTGPNSDKAVKTIDEAKRQNPGIQIIAQMGWASGLLPLVADPKKAESRLDTFAKSIGSFVDDYRLQGIDFDWELVPAEMTMENATHLFTQTRQSLGPGKIMTITPDRPDPKGQSLDVAKVNELFDAVIAQSYERVEYIDSFIAAKIKSSILFCGISSEYAPDNPFWPPGGDISKYIDAVKKYSLPGLYCWRIDNDDTANGVPRYTITSKMWEYSRGEKPNPPLFP
jgi:Glycosyl hydrolases family 18